ncbi:uncharacterized protein DS421_10g294670 [Arachis hypogaea]|nr:uncharacterized protein DS421_10g294670 [Arachis hypogaea]
MHQPRTQVLVQKGLLILQGRSQLSANTTQDLIPRGGTRKFTATGMRNRKGKDNTFVERSLHESSESIDIASTNGVFNKNLYSLTQQVKESQQDKRHSFK